MRMIVLVLLATCIVGNFATIFDSSNMLMKMMSRLEILERKSEKYDVLLQENELLKKLIYELSTKVHNLEECKGFKDKEEIHNFEKLSSKVNASQSSKGSVGNENLVQIMPMTEAKQSDGTKDNVMMVSHINKRIGDNYVSQTFLIIDTVNPSPDQIAFYAYMSTNTQPNLPKYHILRFDVVEVNRGEGYHKDDGVFTVPRSGVYVFAWTIAIPTSGWVSVEIVVDGRVVGSSYAHGSDEWDFSTGIVVVQTTSGDHVFIRMHQNGSGVINSEPRGRSSFSGWLLF